MHARTCGKAAGCRVRRKASTCCLRGSGSSRSGSGSTRGGWLISGSRSTWGGGGEQGGQGGGLSVEQYTSTPLRGGVKQGCSMRQIK